MYEAHYHLGRALLAQGDYDKALAALQKNVRPAGINYFWLGAAYTGFGIHDASAFQHNIELLC